MSIATLLRPTPGAGSAIETSAPSRLAPARRTGSATDADATGSASTAGTSAGAPLRGRSTSVDGALQTQVARAQQAVDYLERVAGQLDALKGELTSRLTSARSS